MRRQAFAILLLSSVGALAQAPQGASPPIPEPETIYSDAQRSEDATISHRTVNAVLQPADATEGQYARWKQPVCFHVYGLRPAPAYEIEKRMREVAHKVGAPVDRNDPCAPNVTIAFTSDAAATLASIYKARPDLLPYYDMIASRVKQSQPIQGWYGVALRSSSGREEMAYDAFDEGPRHMNLSGEVTRLSTGVSTSLRTVMIVVDIDTAVGKAASTLADYFAVLALAETKATSRCKEVPTIINLNFSDCSPGNRPESISDTDLAMLTGLYLTPDNALQRLQQQRIVGNMRRTLERDVTSGK